MLRTFLSSTARGLRARLLAIVFVAVVPMVALLFVYASYQNSVAENGARAAVRTQLDNQVRSIGSLVTSSRATLVTFGITYAIQAQDWSLVRGNTIRLHRENPEYAVVAVADETGLIRASSPRAEEGTSIADEPLFKRAVATRGLTVSNYDDDPVLGGPTIAVSLPVYDRDDRLVAVEYVSLDADGFRGSMSAVPSTVSTLIDGTGKVIVRDPPAPGVEGRVLQESALIRAVLETKRGSTMARGLDRVLREYYFAPVFPSGEGTLYLASGFSAAELLADQRRTFSLLLVGFGIFSLAALIVAWLVGTYSIYRPTLALEQAATCLSEGDLKARVDLGRRRDEIGLLGERFNGMAQSMEHQVDELRQARTELARLNVSLEERVRRRTAELEASNKELEAFSYSVSHDLRSPLRAIDGYSLALLEDYADVLDEQGLEDLRRVRHNAGRMGELIDSLLKLSRLSRQEMDVHAVDLTHIAEEIAEGLMESEPERDVVFEITPGLSAEGDPALLRIAIENLMSNAWKFTGKREKATIEFGKTESDGGEAAFFVRDNGAGFDMAYSNKLFGAFRRVHGQSEFPGIGIGLATTARIIRRHGGRIWAEGEPDNGATFTFTLPFGKA